MTTAECPLWREGPENCAFVTCRHHALTQGGRTIHPDALRAVKRKPLPLWTDEDAATAVQALPYRCSLDFAEGGPRTIRAVAMAEGVTKREVVDLEKIALHYLREGSGDD